MIATTIEQSKKLVRLGLDPKTANMCWVKDYTEQWVLIADTQTNIRSRLEGMYEYSGFQWQEHIALVPAWSLSALLEVMRQVNAVVTLQVTKLTTFLRIKDNGFMWQKDIHVKNPMDAVYGGMLWLLEQGLIKKGDNND